MKRSAIVALLPLVAACSRAREYDATSTPRPVAAGAAAVEPRRPVPYPVFEPLRLQRAIERGTRTRTGEPGPNYWQQHAAYELAAEFDPAANRLTGRGAIRYTNNASDTLRFILLHLHQNLFRDDAVRNEQVPITGGMTLARVAVDGQAAVQPEPGRPPAAGTPFYLVNGTLLRVRPSAPVPPGGSVRLELEWSFTVPPDGAPRGGQDGEVWFMSYWYPQVAVYDDVNGWQADPYMGRAEFYMGYADYNVALTVPEGWLIASTGALVNADEVLSAQTRERLAASRRSRAVTSIVGPADRGAGRATTRGANGRLTWRFRARNVRDFDFGLSDRYLWDATIAEVGDHDGDGRPDTAAAYAFWRPEHPAWRDGARYVQYAVEFLSRWLWPYPWPQMTAVDGVRSCSGMEYPMITCIGGGVAERDSLNVMGTTLHETAHMWFPMMVGSDEKRFAWQDEGLTTFNTDRGMWEYRGSRAGVDPYQGSRQGYLGFARGGDEVELMRHGDLYPPNTAAYGVASYPKMASNTAMLLALLGDSTFLRAYREYGRRWMYRHPTPHDFFNTFNAVAGRDLSWFWRTWWYETWTLDQAVAEVRTEGADLVVVVEDRGLAPMPARVSARLPDGAVREAEVPVERWLAGSRRAEVRLPGAGAATRVEVDAARVFADVDRGNNVWTRPGAARTMKEAVRDRVEPAKLEG
jgi:hypothetical protein